MAYRKLSEEQRAEVRRLLREGRSAREIARTTGVSQRTVLRERQALAAEAGEPPAEPVPEQPPELAEASEEEPVAVQEPPAPVAAESRAGRTVLQQLLEELRESPEGVKALREALTPELLPADRLPKGPRRTMAFYLSEELGRLIRAQARRLDVAPSVVVEQILWRAKQTGWLG